MARHTYFEELCALAPLGDLSPSQLRELDAHIAQCDSCRQAMLDYDRFFRQVVPAVTESDEEYIESRESDVHAAVLRGMAAIDQERKLASGATSTHASPLLGYGRGRLLLALYGGIGAVTLAALAFYVGAHFYSQSQAHLISEPHTASTVPSNVPVPKPVIAVPSTLSKADDGKAQLVATLDEERHRNVELANELAQAIADRDGLRSQIDQQTQTLNATKADLDAKKAQLELVQATKSADAATVASLELEVRDLNSRLNSQTASLDRERDLLSHNREIRDIIGARNLHIIDIADTDMEGATKKPFARAFYTEGKSLVYYAYDLPQRRADEGKFSYVAWGESNGNKDTIKKIGILFHDDQTQKRWSLNFADPQVLREIDSVFITLERNDDNLAQPKGKRMLTAYLGTTANHP